MSVDDKPHIWCSSYDSMHDEPIHVVIRGLTANDVFTLYAHTRVDSGNKFESFAHYQSNDQGCIDLNKDSCLSGSFIGNEPMGMFWSMKPSLNNKNRYARMVKVDVTTPLVVTICVYDGKLASLQEINDFHVLNKHPITQSRINRWMMSSNTERIPLTMEKDGIYGTLFVPAGPGPFPGVLTLFGSYPGTLEYKAALLASHGFAALALSYLGLPGLPEMELETSLKFEYFEKAAQVLLNHPMVDKTSGLGVIGLSFSSFIVLLMGAFLPCIKCVVCLSGFHYPMFSKISYKDKIYLNQPLTHVQDIFIDGNQPNIFVSRPVYPKHMNPWDKELDKSRIPFYDRHDVAYMFIAGLSDENTPSEYYINQIEKLLKAAKHPNYKLLRYPGAGHLIEPCYGIHNELTPHKSFGVIMNWGGDTIPHCKAQKDSWNKQIEFLKLSLFGGSQSKL